MSVNATISAVTEKIIERSRNPRRPCRGLGSARPRAQLACGPWPGPADCGLAGTADICACTDGGHSGRADRKRAGRDHAGRGRCLLNHAAKTKSGGAIRLASLGASSHGPARSPCPRYPAPAPARRGSLVCRVDGPAPNRPWRGLRLAARKIPRDRHDSKHGQHGTDPWRWLGSNPRRSAQLYAGGQNASPRRTGRDQSPLPYGAGNSDRTGSTGTHSPPRFTRRPV